MTDKEQYEVFKKEWEAIHSISKAPSFTSWKQLYKRNTEHLKEAERAYNNK